MIFEVISRSNKGIMVVLIGISLINVLLVNICGYLLLLEPKLFSSQLVTAERSQDIWDLSDIIGMKVFQELTIQQQS